MSVSNSDDNKIITRETLNRYLSELAKEYKRGGGRNTPAEIVMVGGAAIIAEYQFRDATEDIDALIPAASVMKEAIAKVEERYHLPHDWINTGFTKTASYSRGLVMCSSYYRTFSQVFNVRVVKGEYLVAMKLRSYRDYKNDISDIVGILAAHKERGNPITLDMIDKAVKELYGSWDGMSSNASTFIREAVARADYEDLYLEVRKGEQEAREIMVEFIGQYPDRISKLNVTTLIEQIRKKKHSTEPDNTTDQSDRRDNE